MRKWNMHMVLLPIDMLHSNRLAGLAMFGFVIRSLDSGLDDAADYYLKDLKVAGDYVTAEAATGSGQNALGLSPLHVSAKLIERTPCGWIDTWLRMPASFIRGVRKYSAPMAFGQSVQSTMPTLSKKQQEKQRGWYPEDTRNEEWRKLLCCYPARWMSLDEHTTSFCPPLPVVPIPVNPKLTKPNQQSGFVLTDEGKKILALCQPHRARLFGLNVEDYLHPARGIFGNVCERLRQFNSEDANDRRVGMDVDDEKERATEEMDIDEQPSHLGVRLAKFCSHDVYPMEKWIRAISNNIQRVAEFVLLCISPAF